MKSIVYEKKAKVGSTREAQSMFCVKKKQKSRE